MPTRSSLRPLVRFYHARRRRSNFTDTMRITARGGAGGNGCSSFIRTRTGFGAANGGNGGNGGNVFIRATVKKRNLALGRTTFNGKPGMHGSSDNQHGKHGADVYVNVPIGTVVKLLHSKTPTEDDPSPVRKILLADILQEGEAVRVCYGGRGGFGNRHYGHKPGKFAPLEVIAGQRGETVKLMLELKCIADVGLVGYPNAGKSTFLNAVSRATPKCAAYPFTTLAPSIGVMLDVEKDRPEEIMSESNHRGSHDDTRKVERANMRSLEDMDERGLRRVLVADIPGIIEGASQNRGLGHEFLRHIERTKVLLYVVDISATEFRDPVADFECLRKEVELYSKEVAQKPAMIFANKVDFDSEKAAENLERLKQVTDLPIVSGSALRSHNIRNVIQSVRSLVDTVYKDAEQRKDEEGDKDASEFDSARVLSIMENEFQNTVPSDDASKRTSGVPNIGQNAFNV